MDQSRSDKSHNEKSRRAKIALMAASSLIAAAGALQPVHANQYDPGAYPAIVQVHNPAVHGDHHTDERVTPVNKKLVFAGIAVAAFAGLFKIIGSGQFFQKIAEAAPKVAKATKEAAGATVRVVKSTIMSPLKMLGVLAGLGIFALTGIGFYDVEWIGGLVVGAAFATTALYTVAKSKMPALKPIRIRKKNR